MNGNQTNTSGVQQTGAALQPQANQTQDTATGFQTGSTISQDNNQSTENLLNQGVSQPSLTVVSSPFKSSTAASSPAPASPQVYNPSQGSGINFVLILVVGILLLAAAGTWNRYVKTPVPNTKKRS